MSTALIIAYILIIANSVFMYFVLKEIKMVTHNFDRKIHELHIDNQLSSAFDGKDAKDMSNLAAELSLRIKKKYNLPAKSFNEMVMQIQMHPSPDEKLKGIIKDFYDKVTTFAYRGDGLSEEEKSRLKHEYKVIINMLR